MVEGIIYPVSARDRRGHARTGLSTHQPQMPWHEMRPFPDFNAEDYKGRNAFERNFNYVKLWRGLATRYDKPAIIYRGEAVRRAITLWPPHLSDTP